tara:strand:- start:164 stop:361 length:198 start_codon:yes stop_codon:yes gene_type:complete
MKKENDIKLGEYVFVQLFKDDSFTVIKIYEDEKTGETLYDLDDRDNFIMKGVTRDKIRKIPKRGW